MKPLLLILFLAFTVTGQSQKNAERIKDWNPITEAHNQYGGAAFFIGGIKRDEDVVKFWIRADMLEGAWLYPLWHGSGPMPGVGRVLLPIRTNCRDGMIGNGNAFLYNRLGKMIYKYSIKETISEFAQPEIFAFFCERGTTPNEPPKLKPVPK